VRAPETRYAKSPEGFHLAYQVAGDAEHDLVFVGPALSHLDVRWEEPGYAAFLERLSSFARLISIDKRGSGLSDRDIAAPTPEQQVADIVCVMDAMGCAHAHLFGSLDGGASSLLLASMHPERVASVAVYGSFARLARDDNYPAGLAHDRVAAIVANAESFVGSADSLELLAPSRSHDPAFREWYARYSRASCSPGLFADWVRKLAQMDIRSTLGTITAPTLVLHRDRDRFIPPGLGRYLADQVPGARFKELLGEDYLFYVGDTEELLDEVEELVTGRRGPLVGTDRMLLTVLFTDIVGSTTMAARLGDAQWRRVVARHDEQVTAVVVHHGGRVVKTMGDGVLATFPTPAGAVRAALAVRTAMVRAGLEVRAGVHTGEVEVLGEDISGFAVNLAARLQDACSPGSVLVSRTVTDLVAGSGLRFRSQGERTLRGIPGTWEVYSVE
jgi:class 3 adenylate cyclase